MTVTRTLRAPSDLVDAQFVKRDRLTDLERVAARCVVAITPAASVSSS